MTSKERVSRAVRFENPDRVPILYFNKDFEKSDMLMSDIVMHFMGPEKDTSEYGFKWERHDNTMGQPIDSLIKEYEDLDSYTFPDPADPRRFEKADEMMKKYGDDKYYIASLSLTGFTVMTFLRGFEETMVDLYTEPEDVAILADKVFKFEEEVIRQAANRGFSAVAFFDDWGTQSNLLISGKQWREFFKPRYKRQFDLCHELGMDVYFHCCGYILDIIPDFIEIGVDILNISQPNIFDIKQLGKDFGGKVCFICPVSYQTTSLSGTKDDIYADVKLLVDNLGNHSGGLIGYVEEYESIGLTDENYNHIVNAFMELGRYPANV